MLTKWDPASSRASAGGDHADVDDHAAEVPQHDDEEQEEAAAHADVDVAVAAVEDAGVDMGTAG